MEVTRQNFKEQFEDIAQSITESDFIAIDGEFTGLGSSSSHIHAFDTPSERYSKIRQGASDFLLMQFGMCTFKYMNSSKQYVSKAYNFYVFPRPFSRQAPDTRFLCQSSSIDFLISQGFDFNKLFRDGISYLNLEEEQRLRDLLAQKHEMISSQMTSPSFTSPGGDLQKGPLVIPDEHKTFIDGICEKLEDFLKSDKKTLDLLPCSSYLRKLTYQTVSLKFRSSFHLETKKDSQDRRYIVVSKVDGVADFQAREARKRSEEIEELDDAVGFSKIIKLISESGKLVIGHNMMLDLIHIINRFRCQLPADYEEFKSLVPCVFPSLIDTKVMASSFPFKDHVPNSALGLLRKTLEEKPFKKPNVVSPEGFPSYDLENESLHEAGYDAFITGLCFAAMTSYLGQCQDPPKEPILPGSACLRPFLNKIFLMRTLDITYFDLGGQDIIPSRDHVFHVTFPREWKTSDITQLFSSFGSVYVAWLDDTSAFVALNRKDQAKAVPKFLPTSDHYRVLTYEEFKQHRVIASHQSTPQPAKKRSLPASDVDLPRSRKRSHERSSLSGGNSIPPIQEEEEELEEETGTTPIGKTGIRTKKVSNEEDLGVPLKRAKLNQMPGGKTTNEKLFDEPAW